jgi:hypothetical protein
MGGRKQNRIKLRGRTYIVGEGITEQFYFAHLKHLRKYNCVIKPRFFGKTSISEIEKSVQKLLLGAAQVICVFDIDVSVRDESENKKLEQFRKRYVRNKNVIICESYPSIEFWFLLHYIKTTRNFQNAGEVLKEFRKYMPGFLKEACFLEKQKWVEELCANGKLTNAIARTTEILTERKTDHVSEYFSYTKVGKGIEWLDRQKQ